MTISASIGIALFPEKGSDPEELIRLADRAMYRIKNSGKKRLFLCLRQPVRNHLFEIAHRAETTQI